jgi:hypothetical protein
MKKINSVLPKAQVKKKKPAGVAEEASINERGRDDDTYQE